MLIGGICGVIFGFGLLEWITVIAYPHNVGGRPMNSWPAYIPITFECMILFSALTAMISLQNALFLPVALALCGLLNGYVMRVIRTRSANPRCDMPEWDNWMDLWMSGITWISVVFSWVVIAFSMFASVALAGCAAELAESFEEE